MSRAVGILGAVLSLGLGVSLAAHAGAEDHEAETARIIHALPSQGAAKTESADDTSIEVARSTAETVEMHELASQATRYQTWGRLRGRAANVELAASRLDGIVIPPGGEISFNEIVGDRTRDAGFRMAPVIRNGELDRGIGGGVCQVAGTLFAAAYRAGFDVVEHAHHTWPSAYITPGLDATVVYGAADLRLRNPYDFAVTVHMTTDHARGRLEATLEGAGEIPAIEIYSNTVREMPAAERIVTDPSLPTGARVVESEGRDGSWVGVTRMRGTERDSYRVRYEGSDRVVRVGTGPAI